MDAATFRAALDTVEQDHHLVVDRMQALKEVMTALTSPGDVGPQVFARLQELDRFFVTQFSTHLDEEEKTLFPLLEQFAPEGPALAARLRDEHAALRRAMEDFDNCLGVAAELQDRPPRVVLRDLLTYGWDLWDRLDQHAHAETQGIHACLRRRMKEEQQV